MRMLKLFAAVIAYVAALRMFSAGNPHIPNQQAAHAAMRQHHEASPAYKQYYEQVQTLGQHAYVWELEQKVAQMAGLQAQVPQFQNNAQAMHQLNQQYSQLQAEHKQLEDQYKAYVDQQKRSDFFQGARTTQSSKTYASDYEYFEVHVPSQQAGAAAAGFSGADFLTSLGLKEQYNADEVVNVLDRFVLTHAQGQKVDLPNTRAGFGSKREIQTAFPTMNIGFLVQGTGHLVQFQNATALQCLQAVAIQEPHRVQFTHDGTSHRQYKGYSPKRNQTYGNRTVALRHGGKETYAQWLVEALDEIYTFIPAE